MRRREFISLLGGAAAFPLAARAQPMTPVVGFINGASAEASENRVRAFRRGLSEGGYAEGQNVMVEYHWLEGQYDRTAGVIAELIRRRVAVIAVPLDSAVATAAKAATATIPIVFGVGQSTCMPAALTILAQSRASASMRALVSTLPAQSIRISCARNFS
jgi:putative ABC transport system substrate-binding protein